MHTYQSVIGFGDKVEDKITGFKGIVVGVLFYSTGCNQVNVKPRVDKKGDMRDSKWIDEARLTILEAGKVVLDDKEVEESPGGASLGPTRD